MSEPPKQTKREHEKSYQQPSAKLRGGPRDILKPHSSKILPDVPRHGAEKEGIPVRSDGFALVNDLVGYSFASTPHISFVATVPLHTRVCGMLEIIPCQIYVLNAHTHSSDQQSLKENLYQVILMSPEVCPVTTGSWHSSKSLYGVVAFFSYLWTGVFTSDSGAPNSKSIMRPGMLPPPRCYSQRIPCKPSTYVTKCCRQVNLSRLTRWRL